jgi:ribonuclease P protein component
LTDAKPHIRYTLTKEDRLCSEKIIAGLFQPGFFVQSYPLRIHFAFVPLPTPGIPLQVMFTVSKKRFKKAVDRNRIKRLMREVYRLNRHPLTDALTTADKTLALSMIYTGQQLPDFAALKKEFNLCIQKIIKQVNV